MKNKLKNNLKKINSCPICKSKKYNDLGKIIHCNNSDLNKLFNLLECMECQHRFLSRFPNIKFLNKLYLFYIPIWKTAIDLVNPHVLVVPNLD